MNNYCLIKIKFLVKHGLKNCDIAFSYEKFKKRDPNDQRIISGIQQSCIVHASSFWMYLLNLKGYQVMSCKLSECKLSSKPHKPGMGNLFVWHYKHLVGAKGSKFFTRNKLNSRSKPNRKKLEVNRYCWAKSVTATWKVFSKLISWVIDLRSVFVEFILGRNVYTYKNFQKQSIFEIPTYQYRQIWNSHIFIPIASSHHNVHYYVQLCKKRKCS